MQWLADAVGRDRAYLQQLITGNRDVVPELVDAVAAALGCTTAELFSIAPPAVPAEVAESALEKRVREIVEAAPPLSDAQVGRLARLLAARTRSTDEHPATVVAS